MIGLIFKCHYKSDLHLKQVEALQRDIWKKCHSRKLGGFLVRRGKHLAGWFDGESRAVFGVVETMIRKAQVTSVAVVWEGPVDSCSRAFWQNAVYTLEELQALDVPDAPDLAKLMSFPVEPRAEPDRPTGK